MRIDHHCHRRRRRYRHHGDALSLEDDSVKRHKFIKQEKKTIVPLDLSEAGRKKAPTLKNRNLVEPVLRGFASARVEAPTGDTFHYKFTKFILHRREATGPCESPVAFHVGADRLCDAFARVCVWRMFYMCVNSTTAVSNTYFYQWKLTLISVIFTLHLFLILIIRKKKMKS